MTQPLNAAEPVLALGRDGSVTLIDGTTFCLSARTGDITLGGALGLFFHDTRVLSRWELNVDGQGVETLAVRQEGGFAARFIGRRPPPDGRADSTLLVVRERIVGTGLRETVALENVGREATAAIVTLHADSDFADLFAVKAGRPGAGGAVVSGAGAELVLRSRDDASRGLRLTASAEPVATPGALIWRVVVAPGETWSTDIVAQPIVDDRVLEPRFRHAQRLPRSTLDRTGDAWRITGLLTANPRLATVLRRTETDLRTLRIEDARGGNRTFVAAGAPWFMTLFGRDSLLTAWMALPLDVELAVGTLQTLAAVQGRRTDPFTEEEPGRVLHELRLGPNRAHALGGTHYYGTVDATPLFVMLLGEVWRWGADPQVVRALLPAADAALEWMRRSGDRNADGFLEYLRATDRGLVNQGWKDSFDGINDATGTVGEPPIALVEVQGYAYAAWRARAELARAFDDPDTAAACEERAGNLRKRFNERFWLPERGWYAVALDRDKRPLDALTSNPGHCLWTGIADDEPAAAMVAQLGSSALDSGFGLRTLAAGMGAYNPMSYHNGSVWPHDTALCVAGLMRYRHIPGAVEVAHRLADSLLDAAAAFGGRLPELFCGFPRHQHDPPVPYPTSCSPQAWASAAPLLLVRALLGLDPHVPERRVTLCPRVPPWWGTILLDQLRLGPARLDVVAIEETASIDGAPADWEIAIE
jgi:glycogen debranching enzyme